MEGKESTYDVGEEVVVRSMGVRGRVAFVGALEGKEGRFFGVVLSKAVGRNDGSLGGRKYFSCAKNCGTFVREENLAAAGVGRSMNCSAARSHEVNEEYMRNFEDGLRALGMDGGLEEKESKAGGFEKYSFRSTFKPVDGVHTDWARGPRDPQGVLFDASDQPLLCSAMAPDFSECVVGGCDHGLRVFDVVSGKQKRDLYTKTSGHSEWVTACAYLPDGRIISAGMDSKICLWQGAASRNLIGHSSSISALLVAQEGSHCVSASYDKTIRIWNLRSGSETACLKGHKAPILDVVLEDGILLSGSRDGMVQAWFLERGERINLGGNKHSGHVTALLPLKRERFATGDQSGQIHFWDFRQGFRPEKRSLSAHSGGAVNEMRLAEENVLVSAGADSKLNAFDIRNLSEPLLTFKSHKDFIYKLHVEDSFTFSGSGDGMLLVHDLKIGRLCYGLGANAAGIRCIETGPGVLVAAGDDGKAISYRF